MKQKLIKLIEIYGNACIRETQSIFLNQGITKEIYHTNQELLSFIDTLFTKDQEEIMARLREIKCECKERTEKYTGKEGNPCYNCEWYVEEVCDLVKDKCPEDWNI